MERRKTRKYFHGIESEQGMTELQIVQNSQLVCLLPVGFLTMFVSLNAEPS